MKNNEIPSRNSKYTIHSIIDDSQNQNLDITRRAAFWLCGIFRNKPDESEDEIAGLNTATYGDGSVVKHEYFPNRSYWIINTQSLVFGYDPFTPGQYIFYDGIVNGVTECYIRMLEKDGGPFDSDDFLGDFGLRAKPTGGIDFLKYAGRGAVLVNVFQKNGHTIAEVQLSGWNNTEGLDYRLHIGVMGYTSNP